MKKLILFVACFIALTSYLSAQTGVVNPNELLVYKRDTGPTTAEHVRVTINSTKIFSYGAGICTAFSPEGLYASQSNRERADLSIYRLDTQELILQTPWQSNWGTCAMSWETDGIIFFLDEVADSFIYFDVISGQLIPTTPPSNPVPDYKLPNHFPIDRVYPSPDGNHVFYEYCIDGDADESGASCRLLTTFVIFDQATQTIILEPDKVNSNFVRGSDDLGRPAPGPYFAWSSTGRYLVFPVYPEFGIGGQPLIQLSIYDVQTMQYLVFDFITEEIDFWSGVPQWSPGVDRFVFWIEGEFGEDQYVSPEHKQPAIYDVASQSYYPVAQAFDVENTRVTWAPDGRGFLVLDVNGIMYYVSADTGQVTVVDTNVLEISAWYIPTDTQMGLDEPIGGVNTSSP